MTWDRDAKRRHHLRQMGRPQRIRPDEVALVKAHLTSLHDEHGMSWREIALSAGIKCKNGSSLGKLMIGKTGGMLRDNYVAVMAVLPVPPGRGENASGALVSHVGAQRRLRALVCLGFPINTLGEIAGWGVRAAQRIVSGYNATPSVPLAYIYASRDAEVRALYEKLWNARPEDYGVSAVSIGRAHRYAARNGFAPPGCWDEDTIDSPGAYPEWTGQCGRMAGVIIHLREGQPLCERCEYVTGNPHGHNKIDPFKLFDLISDGNHTHREVAEILGVPRDLVSQYAQYISPEERKIHRLSMVDKYTMTGYCDLCRDQVKLYTSTGSKVVCSNGVRKYRKENGHDH